MLKIIGVLLLIPILFIVILFVLGAMRPAVPKDYMNTVHTGGEIEATYLKNGTHEVKYFEEKTQDDFQKYEVYYPADLEPSAGLYPVIVVNNGTGVRASKTEAMFRHFASWGFVVIGTEEEESWDAVAAEKSLTQLLQWNEDANSLFFQKIDVEHIGAVGHSQGGVGAANAVTATSSAASYRTVVLESPTSISLAESLSWSYDPSKITIPCLITAGTGPFDSETVIPLNELQRLLDAMVQCPFKAAARRSDTDHGEMLYSGDGYVTAWFMWLLQGDEYAAGAFTGNAPELLSNRLWQDQKITMLDR